ncbi:MAG: hypothetical protein WA802_09265 [Terracidiphilus sp.]
MLINPYPPGPLTFITEVAQLYANLMHFVVPGEESLGGKLLYAGDLKNEGRALLVVANIAGAASLAATADTSAQKQAIRDGTADFLVTNLDEALRILKNEIRKREPVSVAISIAPVAIVNEMLDRGVLPDLLPPQSQSAPVEPAFATFIAQGARQIAAPPSKHSTRFLVWQIPNEYAQRPAAFDALLTDHIPPADLTTRRWLRQAPRYLGPQFRRLRSLTCDEETASKLIDVLGPPLQN